MNDNATFNTTFDSAETFNTSFQAEETFNTEMTQIVEIATGGQILSNTTEGWNNQVNLISEARTIYVYTDYQTETDENGNTVNIPGLKVGDGKAYLIDMPFTDALMVKHINDLNIHVTPEEKAFWNNKVRTYYSSIEEDTLIFTVD